MRISDWSSDVCSSDLITNGANCAVSSTSGSVAGVNAFVNTVNNVINAGVVPGLAGGAGLQGTTPFPADGGIASTGAFGICSVLGAAARGAFVPAGLDPGGSGGLEDYSGGVPVTNKGKT